MARSSVAEASRRYDLVVPPTLADRIDAAAAEAGVSVTTFILAAAAAMSGTTYEPPKRGRKPAAKPEVAPTPSKGKK